MVNITATADTPSQATTFKDGTTMLILSLILPIPLPRGLRLVLGGLGWKCREGKEEGEAKERRGDERQEVEVQEKQIFDSNYYPPNPVFRLLH